MTDPTDELPALDPRAADLLAAHRRRRAMPPDVRARLADRLEAPGSSGHVLAFRPTPRAERAWIAALACAAALLLVWAAASRLQPVPADSSAVMSPAQAPDPVADRPLAPRAPAPAPEPPAPAPAAAPASPPPAPPVPPARRASAPADVPPAPAPATDLRAETELLARGWQALAGGDIDLASATAGEHGRRFPAGVLVPERQALAAVAACAREPARGRELAAAFLAAHPRSPLARRVRDACELTD